MNRYYDERAGEYDEIYVLGGGPASISVPDAYKGETMALARLVERYCHRSLIDIACGTGFWMPHYAPQCADVTFLDQSPQMLDACRRRAATLGIETRCTWVQADVFAHPFPRAAYDSALVGFYLSHLTDALLETFFQALRAMLRPDGAFLILDSIWSEERARNRAKEGRQVRVLNDGRAFAIYKRYYDEGDVAAMAERYGFRLSVVHLGRVFVAVSGRFPGKAA
jgi:demethylmenaquinone methyltransferase/2-methoxy-6-polyprenyl-1,4-benzoquinol methylase